MPNPYGFESVGGSMTEALVEALMQQDELRRRAMIDELQTRNVESQMKDRDVNRKLQELQIEEAGQRRDQLNAQTRLGTAKTVAGTMRPGQSVDDTTRKTLQEGQLGHLVDEFQPQGPTQSGGFLPVQRTFRGLPEQQEAIEDRTRVEDYLKTLDPESPEARALNYRLMTGENAPTGMFDRQTNQPTAIAEYEYYVKQAKEAGQQPMTFEQYQTADANRKKTAAGAGGSAPYFIPIQTANGVVTFNARTGQFDDSNRQDLPPSASAQADLTKVQSVLSNIGEVRKYFSPDRVGPLKGRYNTIQLALIGEQNDPGIAKLQSTLSTLQNTVIQLRTGAQMSEPEAARIMAEVSDLNLPPDVFLAKLETAQRYFDDWYQKRAKLAFGRNSKEDVDAMVGGQGPQRGAPPPSGTPSAKPQSKYKVTVQ